MRAQGGCLDVVSAGTTSGTNVDWYPCNGTSAQNWTHQSNGELVNPNSGLCLTDPGGNTGARLDIETCTDSADQQWTLPTGGGTGTGNTVTVTGPGNQSSTVGTAASLQINASDSASGQTLSYSATGLPAGLSINSSTGLISGTPTAAGTSTRHRDGQGRHRRDRFHLVHLDGQRGRDRRQLRDHQPGAEQDGHGVLDRERRLPGRRRGRRQHRHPLVQRVQRPAVAARSTSAPASRSARSCLNWETAYATAFQIQTSTDGTNWTTIYSTTTGTGGTQTLNVTGTGRYLRMYGTARATQYGYSLWEFGVYGTSSGGGSGTCGTADAALNKTTTASSLENAAFPASSATRRQPRHPVVERLLRPPVARSRPRLQSVHLPGGAELGARLRDRIPDPDVHQRHDLDHRVLDHQRDRR